MSKRETGKKTGGTEARAAVLDRLAEFFKVFGDATRLKLLSVLFGAPRCVQELADELGMSQSAVSHQLRTLKDRRIVRFRKVGQKVLYSLDDAHIKQIFDDGFAHINERREAD